MNKQQSQARVDNERPRKIFVGGLPKSAGEKDLKKTFLKYGEIEVARI